MTGNLRHCFLRLLRQRTCKQAAPSSCDTFVNAVPASGTKRTNSIAAVMSVNDP